MIRERVVMEEDLREIRDIVKDLETENDELSCENQDLKMEINKLKGDLIKSKHINEEVLKKLDKSNKMVEKLHEEVNAVVDNLQIKDEDIQRLCEENKKLDNYLNMMKKDTEKSKLKLEKKVSSLNICLKEKEALISQMEVEIRNLNGELSDLHGVINELNQDNENIKEQLNDRQVKLEKSLAEVDTLTKSLKHTKCNIKQMYEEHLKKLTMCIQQTERAHQEEIQNVEKLKEELNKYQENNHELKLENVRMDEEIYALKKTINSCSKAWEKTQHELQAVRKEYECYKESIKEMKDLAKDKLLTSAGSSKRGCDRHYRGNEDRRSPSRYGKKKPLGRIRCPSKGLGQGEHW